MMDPTREVAEKKPLSQYIGGEEPSKNVPKKCIDLTPNV
jgi:hypothetical protein